MRLTKFFDTLANMGIWIRLNDSRTEPPSGKDRKWGTTVDGFSVSLAPLNEDSVSVLIRNESGIEKRAQLPGWFRYFKIDFTGPDGQEVSLKSYGRQIIASQNDAALVTRIFPPGRSVATEIPVGALYQVNAPGIYRVTVSCPVPGRSSCILISNEVLLSK